MSDYLFPRQFCGRSGIFLVRGGFLYGDTLSHDKLGTTHIIWFLITPLTGWLNLWYNSRRKEVKVYMDSENTKQKKLFHLANMLRGALPANEISYVCAEIAY